MRKMITLLGAIALAHLAGCLQAPAPARRGSMRDTPDRAARVLADYQSWGALDQPMRVAPFDCRLPLPSSDPTLQASSDLALGMTSSESGPHGKKLYRLFARDPAAYIGVESGAPQGHQVMVKEAFEAIPVPLDGAAELPHGAISTWQGSFRPGGRAGLFIMLRDGRPESEEAAWSYATVSAEGQVTAAGRIASCIRCHEDSPHDGLFGLEYEDGFMTLPR